MPRGHTWAAEGSIGGRNLLNETHAHKVCFLLTYKELEDFLVTGHGRASQLEGEHFIASLLRAYS
jgi:hypothetical protein